MPAPAPIPRSYWVVPGVLVAGVYPGSLDRAEARANVTALVDAGVTTFVDLTKDGELASYDEFVPAHLRYVRLPIRDVSVPSTGRMRAILREIDRTREAGGVAYVHCWGGRGRTGTVIGCHLVSGGLDGETALGHIVDLRATVPDSRQPSPETSEQREFVRHWRFSADADARSRFRGCLVGGAVGDALGAEVEFWSLDTIRARLGPAGVTEMLPAYGRMGAITDDTQMTLFTAEGLIRADVRMHDYGLCDPPAVLHHAYLRWLLTQGVEPRPNPFHNGSWPDGLLVGVPELWSQRAPGMTCLSALESGVMGTVERPLNNSKGCGGAMRSAPVGLYGLQPFDIAMAGAAVTHGHPSGYHSAGALAVVINSLQHGASLLVAVDDAIVALRGRQGAGECERALELALRLAEDSRPVPETVERLGGGWVGEEALAIAVYCALVSETYRDGVLLAVNHSGDSDSTGAIAGNILGTLHGEAAIPDEWLELLEFRALIGELADDLCVHAGYGRVVDREREWERYPGW